MFLVLHQWICKAQYPLDLKGILATTTSCRVPGPRYWFVLVHWYMYVPSIVSICQYISLSIEDLSHHVSDNLFKSNDSEFMIYKCVSFLTSDMYTMYIHVLVWLGALYFSRIASRRSTNSCSFQGCHSHMIDGCEAGGSIYWGKTMFFFWNQTEKTTHTHTPSHTKNHQTSRKYGCLNGDSYTYALVWHEKLVFKKWFLD